MDELKILVKGNYYLETALQIVSMCKGIDKENAVERFLMLYKACGMGAKDGEEEKVTELAYGLLDCG